MVHALLESWRVLGVDGSLLDMRPVHSNPAIEVLGGDGRFVAGHAVDNAGGADDRAANYAVEELVRRGLFALQLQKRFKFASYWDSLEGLLGYAEEKWRETKQIPPDVLERARRRIEGIDGRYRICIRSTIHLAVYQKREAPGEWVAVHGGIQRQS